MTLWGPAASVAIWSVARPWAFRVTSAPTFAPSMLNWTVPVGMPVPVTGRTVAVKVMVWPRLAVGTRLLVTTVVVGRRKGPTTWVIVALVLVRNRASPE